VILLLLPIYCRPSNLWLLISRQLYSTPSYTAKTWPTNVRNENWLSGEIQDSFLPAELPTVPGWQLVATLKPARQTAGDFYDFIPLPNGRLGIVVADVADKGIGAALFMALSRTLIRTYAVEHHARPDFVMRVANNRILMDAEATLFVTVFYGVLDPLTGRLTYCNAGHNPPYLFKTPNHGTVQKLTRTGIPLGVLRGQTWGQESIQMNPGDVLLLYTDGVVEAQNENNSFFGEKRLLTVAQDFANSAQELQAHILQKVNQFMGDAAQFDDITLMIIAREV
jgi:serine phosphatase RsbU (regulator of sigma subunit)